MLCRSGERVPLRLEILTESMAVDVTDEKLTLLLNESYWLMLTTTGVPAFIAKMLYISNEMFDEPFFIFIVP